MKYFAAGIFWMTAVWSVSAQKLAGEPVFPAHVGNRGSEKAIPDTLYHGFFNNSPVLYPAPVGGWMNGTSGYRETEKGQEVKVEITYFLTGVIYWFALNDKNSPGNTSSLIYRVYSQNGVQPVNGTPRLVPGTVLAADTVPLSTVNAGLTFAAGLNVFLFPQPVGIDRNYVAAFSMEQMDPADTIAVYGTTDGQFERTDYTWEKWNGRWNTIKNAWSLDVDFAIFPIRDMEGASIKEQEQADLRIYPNPATDFIQITDLKKGADKNYVLLDAKGQTVRTGSVPAEETFRVDLSGLAAGYYVFGIYSGNGADAGFYRFVKK